MFSPALVRVGHRLLGRARTIEAFAARQYTLGHAHSRLAPPAIHAQGDLDRVTGVCEGSTRDFESRRILGGIQTHGAATGYELLRATVSGPCVYKRSLKYRVDDRAERFLAPAPTMHIAEGVMSCTHHGGRFFGHSIHDDMPLTLLAGSVGVPVRTSAQLFPHQIEYLRMAQLHAQPIDGALVDRLTIIDDHHQSQDRIRRMRDIRSRIRATIPSPEHTGVFINRKGSGVARRLANEEEVVALFSSRGFVIVEQEQMSATDILSLTSGARIVAGVEGSHFVHGMMSCSDDCTFLVLQPPNRFNNIFKDFSDALDMRYAFVVGNAVTQDVCSIDLDSLSSMLDTLQAMPGSASPRLPVEKLIKAAPSNRVRASRST